MCATEHNNQAQGLWRAAASQESTNARGSQAPQEDVREQSPQGPAHSKDSGSCSLPSWAPAPGLSPRKTRWEPGSSTSEGGRESTGPQGDRAAGQLTSECSCQEKWKPNRGDSEDKGTPGSHARELYPRGTEEAEKSRVCNDNTAKGQDRKRKM